MTMVLGNRIVTANMLELASALLYIEDMRHARRIMVGGCAQQDCMRGSGNASHLRIFQGFSGCVLARP